jgi:hypothetical protein
MHKIWIDEIDKKNLSNLNKIFSNCSYTLALHDGLEEQRNLSIIERTSGEYWRIRQG